MMPEPSAGASTGRQGREREAQHPALVQDLPVAGLQQPRDRRDIRFDSSLGLGLDVGLSPLEAVLRVLRNCPDIDTQLHRVADRFERHHDRSPGTSCRQHGNNRGMSDRLRVGSHGQHIATGLDTQFAMQVAGPETGVLPHQMPGQIDGITEQHGLHTGFVSLGKLPQGLEQAVELRGVVAQTAHQALVRHDTCIKQSDERLEGAQPVAEGMCHATQQLVMHGEPATYAGRRGAALPREAALRATRRIGTH